MIYKLPENLVKYSESPLFTQATVPDALRQDHQTKAGVWGKIVVTSGALAYRRQGRAVQLVTAGRPAVIFPQDPHSVAPQGDVAFRVEFYRANRKDGDQ